jgi:TonB family protein
MPAANDHSYCVWDSPSEPVSILLNLRLVDSVRQWINDSNAAQEEVGGVLLGRLERSQDKTIVTVESCQPAHISHSRGPAFTLTDQEQVRVCKNFSQQQSHKDGLTPVGFMRSDLRNYLQPDVSDLRLLREASPDAIFLLVRPEEWIAGFFSGSEESIGPRFPFDRENLQATGTVIQAPSSQPAPRKWPVQQWAPALVTCLLLMVAAAAYFWPKFHTAPAPKGFGLNVKHLGRTLRLTWNPRALHGRTVLWVNDGDFRQSIALDRRQVADGSALYVPASNEVTFRLETPASADSIRIVVPPPQPVPVTALPKRPAPKKTPVRHPQPPPPSQIADRMSPRPQPLPVATLATPVLPLAKHSRAIDPARPVSAIQPRIPSSLILRAETQVEVEASIEKDGRVSSVEPLWSKGDERLLHVVMQAVSHASFHPAQSNGRDVSSKLVLTFHFADQPAARASRAAAR